jgi:hypothetical protein
VREVRSRRYGGRTFQTAAPVETPAAAVYCFLGLFGVRVVPVCLGRQAVAASGLTVPLGGAPVNGWVADMSGHGALPRPAGATGA